MADPASVSRPDPATPAVGPIGAEAVLDALPVAVVLVDEARRVTGWNRAAEVLYGHPRAEVVGRRLTEVLFDGDDRAAAAALFEVATSDRWDGDFRVRRRDGALLVSSFRLARLAGAGWAWVATDGIDQGLAEQERSVLLSAERAARATSEEALGLVEAIVTSAPVGIAVFDLDLRYVRVNDAYASLTGAPAADHPGAALGDIDPLQADVAADLRRVVTTGRTILERHLRVDGPDGDDDRHFTVSYFPVLTTAGVLVGAGLILTEVTESRRAEAERLALLRRAEAARQRISILATASTVLTTTMELEKLLARLTRVLTPVAADWCVIELVGRGGEVENVAVSHRDRDSAERLATALRATPIDLDGAGPVAEVLRTGRPILASPPTLDAMLHRAAVDRAQPELAGEFSLGSAVVVPIEARGVVLGVLILSTEGSRTMHDDDLDLAVEIAHRAALAVQNARAYQQEHQIAESLQRALLPTTVPSVAGLDLAVRYVAATDGASVGGDWYDVLAFADGTTGIVVGDVVGHDIAATTSMGQIRNSLRAYAAEDHLAPAAALARVDRHYDSLGLTYATCLFGLLDPASSTFRWSNAGHPPPLLVSEGRATFLEDGLGLLLGVTGGDGMEEATTAVRDGDVLVLYTDGLVERRGESLAAGLQRLATTTRELVAEGGGADHICDALLEALVPPEATRLDDVALLVARIGPGAVGEEVHRLAFGQDPESAATARGFTAGVLVAAGWRRQVDTAVLLVSELVTNAVRHACGPYVLTVTVGPERVELAVEDGEPTLPEVREAGPLDESGRGFLLVGALAEEWGVRSQPGGKATWFTLRPAEG